MPSAIGDRISRFIQFLLVLIIAVHLSGCAGQTCRDALGCIELAPGEPIQIAVLNPTTPLDRTVGTEIITSVQLALQGQPNIHGRPTKLLKEDTTCLASDLPAAAVGLSSLTKLIGLIGPPCQAAGAPFTKAILDSGKIVLSPLLQLQPAAGSLSFGLSQPDLTEQLAAQLLRTFPQSRISLAAETSNKTWLTGLRQALLARNLPVNHETISDTLVLDLEKSLSVLDSTDVMLIIIDDPTQIMTALQPDSQLAARVIFTPHQFIPIPHPVSPQGEWYWAVPDPPPNTNLKTPLAVSSQDAARFLLQAVEKTAIPTLDGRLLIPRQKLRAALAEQLFTGIFGAYHCTQSQGCLVAPTLRLIKLP